MSYADLLNQTPKLNRTNSDRLISPPSPQLRSSLTPDPKRPFSRLSSSSCRLSLGSQTPNRHLGESQRSLQRNLSTFSSSSSHKLFSNSSKDIPHSPRRSSSNCRSNEIQSLAQYSPAKNKRVLPSKPTNQISVPNIPMDFYVSPIEWSKFDFIAIALTTELIFINPKTEDYFIPFTLPNITSIKFDAAGNSLSAGCEDGHLELFDITSLLPVSKYDLFDNSTVLVSDWNDNIIVSGSRNGSMSIVDIRVDDPIYSEKIHSEEICSVKFCDRSTSTTTLTKNLPLKSSSSSLSFNINPTMINSSSLEILETSSSNSHISSIAPNNSSMIFATSGNDTTVKLWDIRNLTYPTLVFTQHTAAVRAIQFSPTIPNVIVTGGGTSDRTIKMWNYLTCDLITSVNSGSQVCNLFWNEDYNEIFSTHGFSQNHLGLWKGTDLSPIASFHEHKQRVLFMAPSPDSTRIATAAPHDGILIWSMFPSTKFSLQQSMKYLR